MLMNLRGFKSKKVSLQKIIKKEKPKVIVMNETQLTGKMKVVMEPYESWTKKKYHDSITFLPVDYNSPQESDSSSNYLMNDVMGIGLSLNPNDSLKVISYLKEIGYDSYSEINGFTRISNNYQFFELQFIEEHKSPTINRYIIQLNNSVEPITVIIGNSRIECDGRLAIWYFKIK